MQRTATLWVLQTPGIRLGDLVGYDVEATDGHIGKVDSATEQTDRESIVVDTGFWIFGKKRLIPAGVVKLIDDDNKKVYLSISKARVKDAPDFDELERSAYDDRYYDNVDSYFGGYRDWKS
jgi:hypothetical protein